MNITSLEIPANAPITLNRYRTLQNQSLKRQQSTNEIILCYFRLISLNNLAIQRALNPNLVQIKSAITSNNISNNLVGSKTPLIQQYTVSKNVNNNIKKNSVRYTRSKSC